MALDVSHEYWTIICDFFRFDERHNLLALCKASVDSPARRRYFSQSRWRVPQAEHIAARVASTMTMHRFVIRAVVNESWQQAYLSEFSVLESLQVRNETFGVGVQFDISSELPVSLRQLSLPPTKHFEHVNAGAIARLVNLDDLGISAGEIEDTFVLSGLSKLTRLDLGHSGWGTAWHVHMPPHLRELRLEGMYNWKVDWKSMATLESLDLCCHIDDSHDFNELMEIAPQLKAFRAMLTANHARINHEDARQLIRSMIKVEKLELGVKYSFNGEPRVRWLDATAGLTSLRVLDHFRVVVDDLSPLALLINLEELSVYAPDADWSPIVNCRKLWKIRQYADYDKQNATSGPALKQLPLLKMLVYPFQMSSEHRLVELTTLVVSSWSRIVFQLDWCPKLVDLIFDGKSPLFDATNFAHNVPELKVLKYHKTSRLDLNHLVHLEKLEHLTVDNAVGLQSLREMIGITELCLENTDIADVAVLCNMKKLRSLSLKNTKVEDISVLAELKELQTLDLRGSRVRDVSCLFGHPELRYLKLPSQADCSPLIRNYGEALPRLIHIDHQDCHRNHWAGEL